MGFRNGVITRISSACQILPVSITMSDIMENVNELPHIFHYVIEIK